MGAHFPTSLHEYQNLTTFSIEKQKSVARNALIEIFPFVIAHARNVEGKKMPPDDMIIIMGWIFHTQTSVVGTMRNIKESLGQKIDSNFFRS